MSAPQPKPLDAGGSTDPSMEEILASIRRIISDDGQPSNAVEGSEQASGPHDEDDEEVLDLAEPGTARPLLPVSLDIDVPDLSFREAQIETAPEPEPPAATQAAPPPAASVEESTPAFEPPRFDSLVSTETTASVSHAFNLLSHTILTQNARTLEDLVREMLKPMLKIWLDDNLPPLVERLVRAEIERVARGSR